VALSRRRGFSFIEILIVVSIMVVLMLAAIPFYKEAVMHAQETAATQAIRTLHTAQVQYFAQNNRYATSLRELAGKVNSSELIAGEKSGYKFRVDETSTGYAIHAEPVKFKVNGSRTFFSDETMILRQHSGPEPATAESEEAK
jgi:prepilin-type N-terminal cleavage/methylation domain-containing protein